MVLSRRGKFLTLFFFVVAVTSAAVASLNLAAPLFPTSTMQVPVQLVPPAGPISNEPYYTFPEITFQTPALDANTTLYGNVTLCCLLTMPRTTNGLTYFSTPELFVFSESEYITMKGTSSATPWTSPSEASISGDTFRNYTLNGPAETEILSIHFTAKDPGVYYFVVESRNGETQGHLYLTYYKSEIVENPWVSRFQWGFGVLSILGLIGGAYEGYRTLKTPEEKIQWHPRELLFKV